MIVGTVRDEIELVIPLEVVDAKGQRRQIEFVLDTGFTGRCRSGGVEVLKVRLEAEGHRVVAKGKKWIVSDFEKSLVRIGAKSVVKQR